MTDNRNTAHFLAMTHYAQNASSKFQVATRVAIHLLANNKIVFPTQQQTIRSISKADEQQQAPSTLLKSSVHP
jgi:hypothetical protein